MESTARLRFDLDPKTYLQDVYLDETFARAMYLDGLGFEMADVMSQGEVGGRLKRELKVRPTMNAPKIVQKVLGSTQEYVEHGELDATGLVWRYTITPATLASKLNIHGTQTVVAVDGGCEAHFTATFEARIFGAGSAIEKFMVAQYQDNLEKQATFTRRWIAERF